MAKPQALMEIVRFGTPEEVREALAKPGSSLEVRGIYTVLRQTLLFFAVGRQTGALDVCHLLDQQRVCATKQDKNLQTAMHYLAKTNNLSCVDFLVSKGCLVDQVDALRQTPLFYAARYGGAAMVRKLLELGANPAHKDKHGQTALFYAETLEVCEELVRNHSAGCSAQDAHGNSVVECHRARQHDDIARYLAACAEVCAQRDRLTWAVLRLPRDGEDNAARGAASRGAACAAYVTSTARARDVDDLCRLEDEFIDDHRGLLDDDLTEAELFNQIGLNADAETRRNTIRSIAQPVRHRSTDVVHCTIRCLYMPPNMTWQVGTSRCRTFQAIGYVYFRMYKGERKKSDEADSDAAPSQEDGSAPAKAGGNASHIVISHLKVSREHQRRGVARLLISSVLQFAETEWPTFEVKNLYLAVVANNRAATSLYTSLGFTAVSREPGRVEWVHMQRTITDMTPSTLASGRPAVGTATRALRAEWLRQVGSFCGDTATEEPASTSQRRRPVSVADTDELEAPAPKRKRGTSSIATTSTTASSGTRRRVT